MSEYEFTCPSGTKVKLREPTEEAAFIVMDAGTMKESELSRQLMRLLMVDPKYDGKLTGLGFKDVIAVSNEVKNKTLEATKEAAESADPSSAKENSS